MGPCLTKQQSPHLCAKSDTSPCSVCGSIYNCIQWRCYCAIFDNQHTYFCHSTLPMRLNAIATHWMDENHTNSRPIHTPLNLSAPYEYGIGCDPHLTRIHHSPFSHGRHGCVSCGNRVEIYDWLYNLRSRSLYYQLCHACRKQGRVLCEVTLEQRRLCDRSRLLYILFALCLLPLPNELI